MNPQDAPGTTDDRVLGRWLWQRVRAFWPVIAAVAAIVATAALTARSPDDGLPLDPASTDPDGTRALVTVLTDLGRQVRVVDPDELDGSEVVLLLRDQLTDPQRADLRARVEQGARVVVTDPSSPLTPDVSGTAPAVGRSAPDTCAVEALDRVTEIAPGGGARYDVPAGSVGCFTAADGSWLVVTPVGRGHIVAVGGPGFLVNSALGVADNALLAVTLVTPAGSDTIMVARPVLGAPSDGGGDSLGALVPSWVGVMLAQLVAAFLVLVAWRARRLGRPLVDAAPVRLAAADLTSAVGAMLARNRLRTEATARIAADTRRRVARRLGLPAGADTEDVAAAVAARTALPASTAVATLTPGPPTDDATMLDTVGRLTVLDEATQFDPSTAPEHHDDH